MWRRAARSLVPLVALAVVTEGGLRLAGRLAEVPWRGRPAGGAPVWCAGDSVTYGTGVDAREAWPARLAEAPNARRLGVRTENLGVPGHTFAQAVGVIAKAVPGDGVAVLLGGHNDCGDLRAYLPRTLSPAARTVRDALRSLATYRLLVLAVARVAPASPPARPPEASFRACAAKVAAGFDALARVPARVAVATYPVPPITGDLTPGGMNVWVNVVLRDEAARRGVPLVDVAACVETRGDAGLFLPDGVHLTPAGHEEAAACVDAALPGLVVRG
ncbi:MAG: SGNH/GDSL hydrolase family protein [Myxococcota bacterium]